ncbi:hypothetical protein BGX21_010308 [Mortierella sp. AD011]|nr:hypothetical protein BGX20_002100 [Mortierella sp. AD010]KAF9394579.1 hypothetical protein BGX21_010308 [Mortierella sp. AD011]
MAMSEVREPPPKPTRIRTSTGNSAKSEQTSIVPGTMINGQQSPISKTPTPISRLTHRTVSQGANSTTTIATEQLEAQNDNEERNADIKAKRSPPLYNVSGISSKAIVPTPLPTNQSVNNIPNGNNHVSRAALPRASTAPVPPPKPKRISLAPQPKAKPLNLQSIPLQPKEISVRPMTSSAPITATPPPPAASPSTPPVASARIPNATQSSEVFRAKVNPNSVFTSPTSPATPPPKKPRSTDHSTDVSLSPVDSTSAQQRFKNQMKTQPSSPPPSMSKSNPNIGSKLFDYSTADKRTDTAGTNPTLVGARSRLRSTSDAKASTSLAVAVSQTTRSFASNPHSLDDTDGFNLIEHNRGHISPLVSPTHAPSHLGNSGLYGDDMSESHTAAAAEKLTASLHKIQTLAHEQTERMKHINYAEKKADLAEVVYEKSNLWRARGAEWGGIAKKAWEDRGGMGGIAGGLADRWKKRGDSGNDGTLDYSRHGPAAQIFGLPLEDAVRLSKISAITGVPAVVTRCIEYLDVMGVEEIGLYRVSGSTTNVAKLKAIFDNGNDYDFLQKGNEPQNPHDVATLLKLYLRELPSPIIPVDLMPSFNGIDFSDSKHQPAQRLKDALHHLPLENYILLGTLCQHLSNLADYESYTKMNISNLGLIFCPTLQIGSVLFKNLLGGDGNEEERRKCLLIVWTDLDAKREEMENLEMIKNFEQGLSLDNHGNSTTSNIGVKGHDWEERNENGRQSWEEVDRDLINLSSSPPQPSTSVSQSYHPKGSSGSKFGGTFATVNKTKPEPPLDLYDELMTRELNEATNTPLIDLGLDDESDLQDGRWRRHAREPATNRRSESPSPQPLNIARHERFPAVSIR